MQCLLLLLLLLLLLAWGKNLRIIYKKAQNSIVLRGILERLHVVQIVFGTAVWDHMRVGWKFPKRSLVTSHSCLFLKIEIISKRDMNTWEKKRKRKKKKCKKVSLLFVSKQLTRLFPLFTLFRRWWRGQRRKGFASREIASHSFQHVHIVSLYQITVLFSTRSHMMKSLVLGSKCTLVTRTCLTAYYSHSSAAICLFSWKSWNHECLLYPFTHAAWTMHFRHSNGMMSALHHHAQAVDRLISSRLHFFLTYSQCTHVLAPAPNALTAFALETVFLLLLWKSCFDFNFWSFVLFSFRVSLSFLWLLI